MLIYDKRMFQLSIQEQFAFEAGNNYNIAAASLFDASVLGSMKIDRTTGERHLPANNPALITNDEEVINRVCTMAYFFRRYNDHALWNLLLLKDDAIRLIAYLEKEYHLE